MEKISVFWGILLLLSAGVSDADEDTGKLSLLVGDTVILNTGVPEISSSDTVLWMFETERIAEMRGGKIINNSNYENFKGRLQLNKTTGSLNITNVNINHSGTYMLEIRNKNTKTKIFIVTVTDGVKNVSVLKGDSVTLHTGVTGGAVKWTFGNGDLNPTDKTGDLAIPITGDHHSGNYVLEINNSRMFLRRTYHVVLIGEKPRVSVKEGERILLSIGVKNIQTYDLILLNFKSHTIAKIYTKNHSMNDIRDGRLQLDIISGSLLISNSATTDTGDYNLTINSSTHSLQRTISVTVSSSDSGVSPGAEAGIIVGLLVFHWCLQL